MSLMDTRRPAWQERKRFDCVIRHIGNCFIREIETDSTIDKINLYFSAGKIAFNSILFIFSCNTRGIILFPV